MRRLLGFEVQELRFKAGLPHLFLNPSNFYEVSEDLRVFKNGVEITL